MFAKLTLILMMDVLLMVALVRASSGVVFSGVVFGSGRVAVCALVWYSRCVCVFDVMVSSEWMKCVLRARFYYMLN